jgi:hypothetical protein
MWPTYDNLEEFLFALFKNLRCASIRLFPSPLLHLGGPALVLQFCLAFAFFYQARYVNGRFCRLA